jgi:hypothetical protein
MSVSSFLFARQRFQAQADRWTNAQVMLDSYAFNRKQKYFNNAQAASISSRYMGANENFVPVGSIRPRS